MAPKLRDQRKLRAAPAPETEAERFSASPHRIAPHPTLEKRAEIGKAARRHCPRAVHADWEPPAKRPDPVSQLEAQAATRVPELVPIRYGRMLVSPFAFFRGAAAIMATDLANLPNTGLQVQLCGDAHLSNFGGFASPERELVIDINDFDETLPGPWEWDVKRLAASIEIAGRERDFGARTRRELVLGAVGEYHRAIREFAGMGNLDLWYLHLDPLEMEARWGGSVKPRAIRDLEAEFAQAYHHDNLRALERLTRRVKGRLRIVPHPPLVVPIEDLLADEEAGQIETAVRELIRGYRSALQPDRRRLLESYKYVHAARKVVGVGSVGTRAWIVLLLGRDEDDPLFLQVKEAQSSVLEPHLGRSPYAEHGKRVVEGQWLMQAASDIFLGWERVPVGSDGQPHDYYVRQLWDWKVSADVETMSPDEMMVYGKMCGWTLARAHARSGDRVAIGAYLGRGSTFDHALVEFAHAYGDQNESDYKALVAAERKGRIKARKGI